MDTTRTRRLVAAVALVLGLLSLVVADLVQWTLHPDGTDPSAADVAAQFPSTWTVLGLLSVLGPLVWLVGVPAVTGLVRGHGGVLAVTGGLLTVVGLAAGVGHLALYFGLARAEASSGLGGADLARLEGASDADVLANLLLVLFLVGFAVGPVVLALGLRTARLVPVWVPIAAILAAAGSVLGGPVAGVVQLLALAALWGPVAVVLARGSGADRRETAPDGGAVLPASAG